MNYSKKITEIENDYVHGKIERDEMEKKYMDIFQEYFFSVVGENFPVIFERQSDYYRAFSPDKKKVFGYMFLPFGRIFF
jgi:hypothetical protein